MENQRRRKRPICLYVVDDSEMFRELLVGHLNRREAISVVGEAASGEQAIRELPGLNPDVVLLDYRLEGGEDGITAGSKVRATLPGTRVIVFSLFRRRELLDRALSAGAAGFVTKSTDLAALEDAIRTVVAGGRFIESGLTERYHLTVHELAAVALAANGQTSRQIGEALALSKNTVDTYLKRAAKKLGAANRPEAVAIAVRHGLV